MTTQQPWFLWRLLAVAVSLDRVAKFWSFQHQADQFDAVVFQWHYSLNTRLALGLPGGLPAAWWGAVGLLVAGGALWYAWQNRHANPSTTIAAAALALGAASNGYDRVIYGGVVDYLVLPWLNGLTINLADILITVGCVGIVWQINKRDSLG